MSRKIVELWKNYITAGKKTFSQVPAGLKEEVKEALAKGGRQDLILSK